jgi:hypothetical protein
VTGYLIFSHDILGLLAWSTGGAIILVGVNEVPGILENEFGLETGLFVLATGVPGLMTCVNLSTGLFVCSDEILDVFTWITGVPGLALAVAT